MVQADAGLKQSGSALPNKADVLDYIADMIAEMRVIADQSGCATLAGILELARLEAAQQGANAHREVGRMQAS